MRFVYYLAIFWFQHSRCSDPCTDYHYMFDDGSRSVLCGSGSDRCDRYIPQRWYKVITEDGPLRMPTTPVNVSSCGAVYPIWLNGSYPDASDDIVDRTACKSTHASQCADSYIIQVKNCSSFFVFYPVITKGCPERYCFGEGPCPTKPPSTSASAPSATNGSDTTTLSLVPTQPTVSENDASMTTGIILVIVGVCLLTVAAVLATTVIIKRRQWKSAVADSKSQLVSTQSSPPAQTHQAFQCSN